VRLRALRRADEGDGLQRADHQGALPVKQVDGTLAHHPSEHGLAAREIAVRARAIHI
jgi:hypothetical protein